MTSVDCECGGLRAHTWVRPYGVDCERCGFGVPGGERVDRRLWRRKGDKRVAAVEKSEDQRKPENFFGYRNRITPYGVRRFRDGKPVPYGGYRSGRKV